MLEKRQHAVHQPLKRLGTAGLLAALAAAPTGSETVVLTSYYPVPVGVYGRMLSTGETLLARDGGAVVIGAGGPPGAGTKLAVMGRTVVGAPPPADVALNVDGPILSTRNILVADRWVITDVVCERNTGLQCSRAGADSNTVRVQHAPNACVPTACGAKPPCGTGLGIDDCGTPCLVVRPACP